MKTRTYKRLCITLAVILALLLAGAAVLHFTAMPKTETERKVWEYAKAHGLSYWDYPESLIALLERNPETEQFVLEYPVASKTAAAIDLSEYESAASVPLFMQWDQRWGYIRYGSDVAGITACGPVCLSMTAFYLTKDDAYTPDKMIRFAAENGYYVKGSGSSWTLISEGAETLGFDVTELPLDKNRIRKTLEAGIPIIFVVGPGDFTTSGHFLVMTGWEDGMIHLNDPNSYANSEKLWAYEDIQGQIRNLWSIEMS